MNSGIVILWICGVVGIAVGAPQGLSAHNGGPIEDTNSSTCQCGVFLLGSPPLQFSADATPTLAGKIN